MAEDVQYLVVGVGGCATTTGVDNCALLDVLWDPAGGTSWTNFIDNLCAGFSPTPAAGTTPISLWYHFPIWIPAGTSLGVRARKNGATASTTGQVVMYAFGNPKRPGIWWCGQAVESLGITEASSKGTSHTPGNSGAFSTYATIGTSTHRYGALQFMVNGSDSAALGVQYIWRVGIGSAQMPGTPNYHVATTSQERSCRTGFNFPLFVDIPTSTALQVSATCSGTAEAQDCAFYGVY